jgi:hypothetical protein
MQLGKGLKSRALNVFDGGICASVRGAAKTSKKKKCWHSYVLVIATFLIRHTRPHGTIIHMASTHLPSLETVLSDNISVPSALPLLRLP